MTINSAANAHIFILPLMLSFYSSKNPYLSPKMLYVFLQHVLAYITACDFNSYEKWLTLCKIMLSVKILQRSLNYLCK